MGAPLGNHNAVGGRGGGRRSGAGRKGAGYELRQERFLDDLLTTEINVDQLTERIASGVFYIGEFILFRAVVLGKDIVLCKLMDKLFSDNRRRATSIQNEPLTDEEKRELADALDRAFDEFPRIGYKPKLRLKRPTKSG